MLKIGQLLAVFLTLNTNGHAGSGSWYYQNMNHSNVVDYRTETDAQQITTHRWYAHPKDEDAGNYLVIIYKEDPKLPPLAAADELKSIDLKTVGEYYFTCEQPPERFFFTNGFYFTRFTITNFQTQPDSCLPRALLPLNPNAKHTVHPMKNPSINIASSKLVEPEKKSAPHDAVPAARVARQVDKLKIERSLGFAPPKGAPMGSFKRLSEMPEEVLEK